MKPSTTSLLIAAAVIAILVIHCVDATVVTTCKAAAASDKRVNYTFCMFELSLHHESPDADIWGLAKIAAMVGAGNAERARYDIQVMLTKDTDAKTKSILGQCLKLYNNTEYVFAETYDTLNKRDYTLGKKELAEATQLAHNCDGAFTKAGMSSPFTQYSWYTAQIVIVCTAITNLNK